MFEIGLTIITCALQKECYLSRLPPAPAVRPYVPTLLGPYLAMYSPDTPRSHACHVSKGPQGVGPTTILRYLPLFHKV